MQQRAERASVDRDVEAVRRFEKLTELDRDAGRALGIQRTTRDDLGEVQSLEVLHRDVEISPLGAVLVHDRDMAADPAELLLKFRPPALGLEDFARLPIVARGHQLQRHAAARPGVGGEKHGRHPAAADLLENLVWSDTLEDGRHHRPWRPRGDAGVVALEAGPSGNQFSRMTLSLTASPRDWNTFGVTP